MMKIYTLHLRTKCGKYFSDIYAYLLLCLREKESLLKKRRSTERTGNVTKIEDWNLKYDSSRNHWREQRRKRNVLIYFPTYELCYFCYYYFLYILLPKLKIYEYEKKRIVDNIYLINNKIEEEQKKYMFNKINQNNYSIIFSSSIIPNSAFKYNSTFILGVENLYLLSSIIIKKKREHNKKLLMKKRKDAHTTNNNHRCNYMCNTLYMCYITTNGLFNKVQFVRRKAPSTVVNHYSDMVLDINNSIAWFKHSSLFKFYSDAYVSFLTYRMNLLKDTVKKDPPNKRGYRFKKINCSIFNSTIFFNFMHSNILFIDFKDAIQLYIEYLKIQDEVESKREENIPMEKPLHKTQIIKEIKKNMQIHIWNPEEKKIFFSNLVKLKFRKLYN